MGFAALHVLRREVGLPLSVLAMVMLFINFKPLSFRSSELDEQCVAMSLASLLAVGPAWWCFTKWGAWTARWRAAGVRNKLGKSDVSF